MSKVKQAVHNVEGNKATIDSFTQNLQSNQGHALRGHLHDDGELARRPSSTPSTPSSGGLAFHETQTGSNASNMQLIVNSSGEYACNQSGSGGAWSCQKLGKADAATENKIFDIYTPSHWVSFLKGVSLVAGLAGDKVTSSTMSLNGFDMNCVDLVAQGRAGHEHHLQHVAGDPRLRQGRVGLDELPDHELLVVARAVAVPAAARRHRDDAPRRSDPTGPAGIRTQ